MAKYIGTIQNYLYQSMQSTHHWWSCSGDEYIRNIEVVMEILSDCGLMSSEQIFRNNSENELRFDEMIIISALH